MTKALSRELIYTKTAGRYVGAILNVDHGKLVPDDYTRIYAQFCARFKTRPELANMVTLYELQHEGLIYWHEGLARDGCIFTLYCLPGTDDKSIRKLKDRLRRTRDVVAVYTVKIEELIPYDYKPTAQEPTVAGS